MRTLLFLLVLTLSGVPHLIDVVIDGDNADACCVDDDCSPVCSSGCCGGASVASDVVFVAVVVAHGVVVDAEERPALPFVSAAPEKPLQAGVFHPPKA